MVLIEEFEGATTQFIGLHNYFGTRGDINPKVHFGPTLIPVKNVDAAIEAVKKYIEEKF